MSKAFYDYVRFKTEIVPDGYDFKGLTVYRRLVYLGVSEMVGDCFPSLKEALDEVDWEELMKDFISKSSWDSHFYGDLENEFRIYIERESR